MALKFEDLRVLQAAEAVADDVWRRVVGWESFARDTVGKQLARAADSVGANVAEAFGRFHYGEKLQFLYYARGSLFETKYWLNRTRTRDLMPSRQVQNYASQLTDLARQLNAFAASLKAQRQGNPKQPKTIRESPTEYAIEGTDDTSTPLFTTEELEWLEAVPNL